MSLRIQPSGGQRGTPRGRSGSGPIPEALLRELADLRTSVDSLRDELAQVRAGHADAHRQIAELKEQTLAQAGRTGAIAEELRRAAAALAIANRALSALLEQAKTHQQTLTAAWTEQQQQLRTVLERLEARREQTRQAIESLESAEGNVRQSLERQLDAIRDLIEHAGSHLSRELEAVSGGIGHLEQLEQAAQGRLRPAIDLVQQQFQALTQALAGIEAATASVFRQNDRVAAAHDDAARRASLASARHLNDLGLRALAADDPATAARHFDEACRLAPAHPEPRFNLALAWLQQGDCDRAAAALDALPQPAVHLPETQFLQGLIELAQGDPETARQRFAAIEGALAPDSALQSAAGLASLLSHDARGAVAAFRRAIRTAAPADSALAFLAVLSPPSKPPANPGAHD